MKNANLWHQAAELDYDDAPDARRHFHLRDEAHNVEDVTYHPAEFRVVLALLAEQQGTRCVTVKACWGGCS